MVGWSRRNAESRDRERRWWASLTDDEREMRSFRDEVRAPIEAFHLFVIVVSTAGAIGLLVAVTR